MSPVAVCRVDDLDPERGVAALVGGAQVALFRLAAGDGGGGDPSGGADASTDEVLAVANRDPFTGANVVARGIVGSAAGVAYVASPLHKQRFDLRTGRCLDHPDVAIETYPVSVVDGVVHLAAPER